MKAPTRQLAGRAWRAAARRAEARLQAVLRAQRPEAPELFSDRDEDASEYECILREFERARNEALSAGRYN